MRFVRHILQTGSGSTSTSSPVAATSGSLKTATIGGVTVLTDARGFAVYSFAPDTMTTLDCNGACAAAWPPVKGPVTAAAGLTGKLGTMSSAPTARPRPPSTGTLCTPSSRTPAGTERARPQRVRRAVARAHRVGFTCAGAHPVRQFVPAPQCPAEPRRGHDASRAPGHGASQTANPIPQGNGGDHDADNNGGPSDGDGNVSRRPPPEADPAMVPLPVRGHRPGARMTGDQ